MENNETSAKKPRLKLRIIIIAVSVVIVALLIFVYLRVNPKWKAAKLTVKQSGKSYGIENIDPEGMTLQTRIKTPDGYKRIEVGQGSFGSELPVYDGTTMSAAGAAAIFDISLGDDGYQQCADRIIRLYSDYFYEKGEYDKISFMFSNGDVCDYNRWRKGKRMLVFGDHSFEIPAALPDDSEQQSRFRCKRNHRS